MPPSKLEVWQACRDAVLARAAQARQAMQAAQASANAETKSSMGDKYETGRAMAQNERDRAATQLAQAEQMLAVLDKVDLTPTQTTRIGSLVETGAGLFFIAIGLGKVDVGGKPVYAVSPASPVGAALLGKTVGAMVPVNSRPDTIISIQ